MPFVALGHCEAPPRLVPVQRLPGAPSHDARGAPPLAPTQLGSQVPGTHWEVPVQGQARWPPGKAPCWALPGALLSPAARGVWRALGSGVLVAGFQGAVGCGRWR